VTSLPAKSAIARPLPVFGSKRNTRARSEVPIHTPPSLVVASEVMRLSSVSNTSFALPPVTTPALRRLRVQHRVDLRGTPPRMEPANLAVYRRLDDKPATWVLNDIAAALLDAFVDGQGSLAERVQAVTRARDVAIDATFLERLSALLADFLERGVLLGSAQPVPTGETGD